MKLRGDCELEKGEELQRENQTHRQTEEDEYLVLKTTQTLSTLMLDFEQRVNKK